MSATKDAAMVYVQVRHDDWCSAQYTQRADDCICNPIVVAVDQSTFIAGIERLNRAARRRAERAAKRGKR
jgi:hypothetical protein